MREQHPSSNLMQGLVLLFFVVNVFLFIAIRNPPHHLNPQTVLDVLKVETAAAPPATVLAEEKVTLQWKLVHQYIDGYWRVEKYQEFEVYTNEKGRIVKEIPTPYVNYLRYWRYE